jgi:hypothetical protein
MAALNISFHFTDQAAQYLQRSSSATVVSFPSHALQQQPLAVGDRIRFGDIPSCPWFVVTERYWDLAKDATTLTIWLGVLES